MSHTPIAAELDRLNDDLAAIADRDQCESDEFRAANRAKRPTAPTTPRRRRSVSNTTSDGDNPSAGPGT